MSTPTDDAQQRSILGICLLAAFADGSHGDAERDAIRGIAATLGTDDPESASLLQDVLFGRATLDLLCAPLVGHASALQACEMAESVCAADQNITPGEQNFLDELRGRLAVEAGASAASEAGALLNPPPAALGAPTPAVDGGNNPAAAPAVESMIVNYAILNAALEMLPQSLATVAVIPMQLKMVYRIGKSHGVELDTASIKELAAAAGLGLTSQVLEGYARRLFKGLLGKKSMAGGLAGQATSSAFAFGSTYALGHVAQAYYAGGRRMTADQIKGLFDSMTGRARGLYETYLPQIRERARGLDLTSVLGELKSAAPAAGG